MSILKTYDVFRTERDVNAMNRFPKPVTKQERQEYKDIWKRFVADWHKRFMAMVIEEFRERS